MKASELRIGNFVENNGDIEEVIEIRLDGFDSKNFKYMSYEKSNYIALTEQWLLKFGFTEESKGIWEKCCHNTHGHLLTFRVMFTDTGYWIILEEHQVKGYNIGHYKYVHTLQNIYPLTGEELI